MNQGDANQTWTLWIVLCVKELRDCARFPQESQDRGVSGWGAEGTVLLGTLTACPTRRNPWAGLSTDNWQKCPSYQPWSLRRISTIQTSAGRATQHWAGIPGTSCSVLVITSSCECWRGQLGFTLSLTCQWWMWSQYQLGLILCDHNWILDLEEGWEGKLQSFDPGFQKKLWFTQGVAK